MIDDIGNTAREIDSRNRERLIHRHDEVACAENALLVAKRFRKGFTQRNANVFDGVMLIDVKVANAL